MKKLFFLPALAAMMFSSCSSDEPNGPNGEPNENGSYLAVNIMAAGGSRATSTDFEVGSTVENKAETALFMFYDGAGNPTQTPQLVDLDWNNTTSNAPQIENISKTVVVVAGKTKPTQMLVILNPGNLQLAGLNLTAARDKVDDYATGLTVEGKFLMTNSSYAQGTTIVRSTDLTTAKFYESKDEADKGTDADAVQVYVERVVAKIRTNAATGMTNNGTDVTLIPDDGGTPSTIKVKPEINGIEVANMATTSFLFKNINNIGTWTSAWPGVNDSDNKRCYWAGFPTGLDVANNSWEGIDSDPAAAFTTYVQENTQMENPTAIIVAATLKVDGKAQDLIRWSDNYYLPERFKSAIATFVQNGGFMVKEADGKLRSVKPEEVDYITDAQHEELVKAGKIEAYHTVGRIAESAEGLNFVKNVKTVEGVTTSDVATVTEINTHLQTMANRFLYWKGGKTYYYVNIEHFGTVAPYNQGVVRNHIYNLNLESISGLGTPVFNPKEIINPQKPDDKIFRMRAQINILKWRIVNQNVNFGD